MEQKPDAIVKDIKAGKFKPVYFLQGEERFYMDQILDLLLDTVVPEEQRSFNQQVLYGQDVKLGQVIGAARRFPMMAERQLVVVKEAHKIADWKAEASQSLMLSYLDQPLDSTVLVFAHPEKTINLRTKVGKRMKEKAVFLHSKKLYSNQVLPWITTYVGSIGLSIHPRAGQLLATNVGENLGKLSREIDKLKLNLGEVKEITEDHISKLVGFSKDFNVFELQNAIGRRDLVTAEKIAFHFERNPKSHPVVMIVSNLFSYFSKVLVTAQNPGVSSQVLASKIKVNPYFTRDYVSAAKQYNTRKIVHNLQLINELDLNSKGIGVQNVSQHKLLRTLVCRLIVG